jgi:hypothetical protein
VQNRFAFRFHERPSACIGMPFDGDFALPNLRPLCLVGEGFKAGLRA